jgi:hypothetical protein
MSLNEEIAAAVAIVLVAMSLIIGAVDLVEWLAG